MTTADSTSNTTVPTAQLVQWQATAASIARNISVVRDRLDGLPDDLQATLDWMEAEANTTADQIREFLQG